MEGVRKRAGIRVPARAAAWYVTSSIIARGVGVLGTPLFTRLLTPQEYGLYPLYNGYLSILTVICSLELTGSVLYKELQLSDSKEKTLCTSLLPCMIVLGVFLSTYLAFRNFFNELTGLSTTVTMLLIGQVFFNIVTAIYTAEMRYEYRYKTVALLNLCAAVGAPTLSVALIRISKARSEARIIGLFLATGVIALALLPSFIKGWRGFFNYKGGVRLIKRGLPLLPYFLSSTLITRINEIAIGRNLGTGALGGYSIAVSLGSSLNIVSLGILSALNPWITRRLKCKECERIRSLLTLCFYALCICAIFFLGAMPEAVKFITPPDFHYVLGYIYPICLAVVPSFLSGAFSSAVSFFSTGARASVYAVGVAVAASVCSLSLVPKFGVSLGAFITLFSYIALSVFNFFAVKRTTGERLINPVKCITAFFITSIYALLLFLFRSVLLSRVLLLLAVLPIGLSIGKGVLQIIKEE